MSCSEAFLSPEQLIAVGSSAADVPAGHCLGPGLRQLESEDRSQTPL